MKTSFKHLILLIVIILKSAVYSTAQTSNQAVVTQNYHNGIGVRLGGLTSGITFKHFGKPLGAFEGILSFGYQATVITALYEQHVNIGNSPGLRWFYGGGGHIAFFRYGGYYHWVHKDGKFKYADREGITSAVVGIDGILGLDYKFNNAPVNISLDLKPFIDFYNGPYGYFDGAVSARFTF
jgi:hypothetical protein